MFIKKVIGKTTYTFQVEGKNLYEMQTEAQKLGFSNVYKCGMCESDSLYLRSYLAKDKKDNSEYEYTKICCANCKSSVTFGQTKKDRDTFFLRKNDEGNLDWQRYIELDKDGV